jgi:hypothetical protein
VRSSLSGKVVMSGNDVMSGNNASLGRPWNDDAAKQAEFREIGSRIISARCPLAVPAMSAPRRSRQLHSAPLPPIRHAFWKSDATEVTPRLG